MGFFKEKYDLMLLSFLRNRLINVRYHNSKLKKKKPLFKPEITEI